MPSVPRVLVATSRSVGALLLASIVMGCHGPTPPIDGSAPPPAASGSPTGTSGSPDAAFPGRLAVLAGTPGSRTLTAFDGLGAAAPLDLPDAWATWISSDPRGAMSVTSADGTIRVAAPGAASWSVLDPGDAVRDLTGRPIAATWSADGRLAALVGDVERAALQGVLVADPPAGEARVVPMVTGLEGSAPAWLDRTRIAVPARDHDRPRILVLDVGAGDGFGPAGPGRAIVASADGSTVAVLDTAATQLTLWRAGPWLEALGHAGEPPPDARLAVLSPPAGMVRPVALTLDRAGDDLAIVWGDADGAASLVTIHGRRAAWEPVAGFEPPSGAISVAWLP